MYRIFCRTARHCVLLRRLRYIRYLNNAGGLATLTQALQARMQTLLGH